MTELERHSARIIKLRDDGMTPLVYPHPLQEPWDMTPVGRCADGESLAVVPLGINLDGRLRWKPPNLGELKQCSVNVIHLRSNGMSRRYSPGPGMTLTLFVHKLVMVLSYPRSPQELWDITMIRRHPEDAIIISTHSHKVKALTCSSPLLLAVTVRHFSSPLDGVFGSRQRWE
jgi:hypothetical protein